MLDAFLAVHGRADDLDVRLEREQLLEVIQGAGDVVHDQDLDWLAHLIISLKKAPREIFRFRGEPVNVFPNVVLADAVRTGEAVHRRRAGCTRPRRRAHRSGSARRPSPREWAGTPASPAARR